jgi:hypothetical protein
MNTTIQPNRFALILDKDAIKAALEHAATWNLKPRVCRPLDTYTGKGYNAELSRYDEAVEALAIADEDLPEDSVAGDSVEELLLSADDISDDLDL